MNGKMQASTERLELRMWQTIGHDWAVGLLERAVNGQRIAHAYLFTGPKRVGKTHLAQRMAAMLNCTGEVPPCGTCSSCLKTARDVHPDISVVRPDGDRIKISQIRDVQHSLALSPYEGRWRVVIISEFEKATAQAANALLKTLEEPPSRVVLILTATDASLLLPTVVSRCQVLALRAVSSRQIERALRDQWGLEENRATLIARLSSGRPGWAIDAATNPDGLQARNHAFGALIDILARGRAQRIMTAQDLAQRDDMPQLLSLWQTWWRDVALLCSNNEDLVCNLDYQQALWHQATATELRSAHHALQGIQAAQQRLEQNVNPRLVLEVLLLDWPHIEVVRD